MSEPIYVDPPPCRHIVLTEGPDGGQCADCGARLRWTVEKDLGYEAAWRRMGKIGWTWIACKKQKEKPVTEQNINDVGMIADAIAHYVRDSIGADILPMVGGFTLVAEFVTPETGEPQLVSIRDVTLPLWTEWGMLAGRLKEVSSQWEVGGVYEAGDER